MLFKPNMVTVKKEFQWLLKEKYQGRYSAAFARDITRLKKGEPLAYLIGFMHFLGCTIDLSERPLIPRPETEFWTEKAIEEIRGRFTNSSSRAIRVLDMFAGSGCIGVSIMRHIPDATMVFAERSKKLIGQVELNCHINGIAKKRFNAVQSDVFSAVKETFDVIVANPPYIALRRKGKVHASVLRHEPAIALFGGADGLLYIEKFLTGARRFLNAGGLLFMEFDPGQKKGVESICKKAGYGHFGCLKDQYGRWRYLVAKE